MAYINTIQLEPQESAQALAEAMAQALGKALKWTVDGTSVWAPGGGIAIQFCVNSTSVKTGIRNSITQREGDNALVWAASQYTCVDYVWTGSTLAVGIRAAGSSIVLSGMIAKNTSGAYKALVSYSNTMLYIAEGFPSYKSSNGFTNGAAGISTSIVKFPDMWGGCMFIDLYYMMSCPVSAQSDLVFFIGGKHYRRVGISQSLCFAVPVE